MYYWRPGAFVEAVGFVDCWMVGGFKYPPNQPIQYIRDEHSSPYTRATLDQSKRRMCLFVIVPCVSVIEKNVLLRFSAPVL